MLSYPIKIINEDQFYKNFFFLKKYLVKHEYRSGFIQRLKDGFGIIHTPRRVLTYGDKTTELLLSLFSDNKAISLKDIYSIIGKELTNNLLSIGFFSFNKEKQSILSKFRIIPVNQFLILIPFRQFNNPPVYIGADSLTFARHIEYLDQPKKILDLATGSGFQLFNLPWQSGSTSMKGLDVNPNAIRTGRINSIMNHTPWIEFEEFNIEDQLNSMNEKFDLVIGNPPIIPTPDLQENKTRLGGMIHADGGRDGFSVVRKILNQIPSILNNNSSLQLILCSLGDSENLFIANELENLLYSAKLQGKLIIVKKIPVELDAYYRGQRDKKEYNRWMAFYKEEKAYYWYRLILRANRKFDETQQETLSIKQLIRNDFSKFPNTERITIDTVKPKLSFYLSDTLIQNEPYEFLSKAAKRIEQIIDQENWKSISIRDFGILLYQQLPDIFPTEGSAIRFWGQCTNEFWWKPKYLERVLW